MGFSWLNRAGMGLFVSRDGMKSDRFALFCSYNPLLDLLLCCPIKYHSAMFLVNAKEKQSNHCASVRIVTCLDMIELQLHFQIIYSIISLILHIENTEYRLFSSNFQTFMKQFQVYGNLVATLPL